MFCYTELYIVRDLLICYAIKVAIYWKIHYCLDVSEWWYTMEVYAARQLWMVNITFLILIFYFSSCSSHYCLGSWIFMCFYFLIVFVIFLFLFFPSSPLLFYLLFGSSMYSLVFHHRIWDPHCLCILAD